MVSAQRCVIDVDAIMELLIIEDRPTSGRVDLDARQMGKEVQSEG
jgi:hypothetical protein